PRRLRPTRHSQGPHRLHHRRPGQLEPARAAPRHAGACAGLDPDGNRRLWAHGADGGPRGRQSGPRRMAGVRVSMALSSIERPAVAWDCERLIHVYAMLNDAGDFDAMAEMFIEDGVFARPSQGDVLIRGKAAILQAYTSRPPRFTRHLITSVVVTVEDEDRA